MASSFVIDDILADVAALANVPEFDTTTNVTLAQATYWLVQSARSLAGMFKQKFGADNDFLSTATLTVPANVGLASLPAGCGELKAVVWARTSSDWRVLRVASVDDLEAGQSGEIEPWRSNGAPRYQIEGQALGFYPPSSEDETVTLFYTTHLDVAGETTFLTRIDGDRWITLDVIIRVLQRQERDASTFVQDKLLLETNLFSAARKRDPHAIHTIRDTRRARTRGGWNYSE